MSAPLYPQDADAIQRALTYAQQLPDDQTPTPPSPNWERAKETSIGQAVQAVGRFGQALRGEYEPMDPATGHASDDAVQTGLSSAGLALTGGLAGADGATLGAGPLRAKSLSPSLKGTRVEVPADVLKSAGLPEGNFTVNYEALAKKHPEYFKTAESAREHVESVLGQPDYLIGRRDGRHLDFIQGHADGDKLIGFRAQLQNGAYNIRTAYQLDRGQLARMARGASRSGATVKELYSKRLEPAPESQANPTPEGSVGQTEPEMARGGSVFGSEAYRAHLKSRLGRAPAAERTIPEPRSTLVAQTKDLADGVRSVVLLPSSSRPADRPALPKGMQKADIPGAGTAYFNPSKISEQDIASAARSGRLNDVLNMGPTSKAEAVARAAAGDPAHTVVLRDKSGVPKVEQGTTASRSPIDAALVAAKGRPTDTVEVSTPDRVLAERTARQGFATGGRVTAPFAFVDPVVRALALARSM